MNGIMIFKTDEPQPKLLGNAGDSYNTDWSPAQNPNKVIKLTPTVWEYNGVFLLVSKFSCSAAGTLTLRVITISRIKF